MYPRFKYDSYEDSSTLELNYGKIIENVILPRDIPLKLHLIIVQIENLI